MGVKLRIVAGTDYPGGVKKKVRLRRASRPSPVKRRPLERPLLPRLAVVPDGTTKKAYLEGLARDLIYRHKLSDGTTVVDALAWIAEGQFAEGYDSETVVRFYKELRAISILPFGADSNELGVYGAVHDARNLLKRIPGLSCYKAVVTDDFDLLIGY
jgi:hypothetical protein